MQRMQRCKVLFHAKLAKEQGRKGFLFVFCSQILLICTDFFVSRKDAKIAKAQRCFNKNILNILNLKKDCYFVSA
jgi:hypothetical protein